MRLFKNVLQLLYLRIAYFIAGIRIRLYAKKHSIKVLFLVSEVAKWKLQSLYDSIRKDSRYQPIICLYPLNREVCCDDEDVATCQEKKLRFFNEKHMNAIDIWDVDTKRIKTNIFYEPGLVFYQQPWDQPPAPDPIYIASKHLTFYIPYYLVNNINKPLELCMKLHKQVFRYIVPSKSVVDFYYSQISKYNFVGKIIGLGHPCTDGFIAQRNCKDYSVIYAPHFSIYIDGLNRPCNYSTFLSNGELILNYAKSHPNVKWVFKPHPKLFFELIQTGVWPKEKVEAYYDSWKEIGEVCLSSDYQGLFVNSDLMITDCGSFLSEYSCTKNPLIRLISPYLTQSPHPVLEEIYDSFYKAHNNAELLSIMDMLIVRREDPNKAQRRVALESVQLCDGKAAARIHNEMNRLIRV